MPGKREGIFFGRHTQRSDKDTVEVHWPRPDDVEAKLYKGVTEDGIERAETLAKSELIELVERAKQNAVIFIGGSSEEERTKSTAEVYGDVLAEELKARDDVFVMTRQQIQEMTRHARETKGKVLNEIKSMIEANPNKKFVFDYPIFLRGWSLRPGFRTPKRGRNTAFAKALFGLADNNPDRATEIWLEGQGMLRWQGRTLKGPNPQEVAEAQLRDISRLRNFARKFIGDRPLIVGFVGHGWNVDALATYLANRGEVTAEGFRKIGGTMMQQPEVGELEIREEGVTFTYRGTQHEVPSKDMR